MNLGIRDVSLFERLLAHYSRFIYDYAPDNAALMAALFSQMMPSELPHVQRALEAAEQHLFDFIDNFSLRGVRDVILFVVHCIFSDGQFFTFLSPSTPVYQSRVSSRVSTGILPVPYLRIPFLHRL